MGSNEVVRMVECGCCGMWEECTAGYIGWVKERFAGVWVCGLCEEAVKDEQARLGVGVEEAALRIHATFQEIAAVDPAIRSARSILKLLKKIISSSPISSPTSPSSSMS